MPLIILLASAAKILLQTLLPDVFHPSAEDEMQACLYNRVPIVIQRLGLKFRSNTHESCRSLKSFTDLTFKWGAVSFLKICERTSREYSGVSGRPSVIASAMVSGATFKMFQEHPPDIQLVRIPDQFNKQIYVLFLFSRH